MSRFLAVIAALGTVLWAADALRAAGGSVECGTVSTGAASDNLGLVVNIGQTVSGGAASESVRLHAGIVGCLGFGTAPPGPCPWDMDGSGAVGTADLLALLAAWGSDPGGPPDFDGDGNVGTTDLLALLANWGPCPR